MKEMIFAYHPFAAKSTIFISSDNQSNTGQSFSIDNSDGIDIIADKMIAEIISEEIHNIDIYGDLNENIKDTIISKMSNQYNNYELNIRERG